MAAREKVKQAETGEKGSEAIEIILKNFLNFTIFRVVSALVKGSQCLQSTRNTSLDPLDDTRSHLTVTGYILHYSVTLVLRLARLSIPGRLAEVSLG